LTARPNPGGGLELTVRFPALIGVGTPGSSPLRDG
ncbi:MAG: hypothetical protein JWN52_2261, partial [Actinomycetia bacterium]|nr:hypothetical protein [Actinomycetes bacterium]